MPAVANNTTISDGSSSSKGVSKSANGSSFVTMFTTVKPQSVKRTVDHEPSSQGPPKKTKLDGGLNKVPNQTVNAPQPQLALKSTKQTANITVPLQQSPQNISAVRNSVPVPRFTFVTVPPSNHEKAVSSSNVATISAFNSATASAATSLAGFAANAALVLASNSATVLSPSVFTQFPVLPMYTTSTLLAPARLQVHSTSFFSSALTQTVLPSLGGSPTQNPKNLPLGRTHSFPATSQARPPSNTLTPVFQHVTQNAYEVLKLVDPTQFTDTFLQAEFFKAEKVELHQQGYHNILNYIFNSQAHQGFRVEPISVLKITRPTTSKNFHATSTVTSSSQTPTPGVALQTNPLKMMLWHGTRPRHVASILRYGFKCPQTGAQMFGKGVYFADRISKSAQYCNPNGYCAIPKLGEIGYLFLCEVTLGKCYNAKNVKKSFSVAPSVIRQDGSLMTFGSLKCTGKNIPDRLQQREIDGVIWPIGPTIQNTRFPSYSVLYNEFVVYNPELVKIKYLVKVQFK